jgi:hypothetical protein
MPMHVLHVRLEFPIKSMRTISHAPPVRVGVAVEASVQATAMLGMAQVITVLPASHAAQENIIRSLEAVLVLIAAPLQTGLVAVLRLLVDVI